jgi:hypothetical protein
MQSIPKIPCFRYNWSTGEWDLLHGMCVGGPRHGRLYPEHTQAQTFKIPVIGEAAKCLVYQVVRVGYKDRTLKQLEYINSNEDYFL